jgi:2-polyprenyl-3-methyl-5-hydroxy-6-metoxy-1,4-benzoquinol methylase
MVVGDNLLVDKEPWSSPWPEGELERVTACPVCGDTWRTTLHSGLRDNVFFVSPGVWTMYRCDNCTAAYLDPRPNFANIGKAYGDYYTHSVVTGQKNIADLSCLLRMRRMIANAYINFRYGTNRMPSLFFGYWLLKCFPGQRKSLDDEFRYLPKPVEGKRLLDVGCGNGSFLLCAREAGWSVQGLEPDPIAAASAHKLGLDVTVGVIDSLDNQSDCFDALTLSHVIEHVHDPVKYIKSAHRLLKLGGILFIDTPSIESIGAQVFGKNWRGIEAPRHLVIFNPSSLQMLLKKTGFEVIAIHRRTNVKQYMFTRSMKIEAGLSPYGSESIKLGFFKRLMLNLRSIPTKRLEFITMTARKVEV